ncbi:hypothetical protein [Amycolatopsis palatopharyngis]|uniref:hypothetical protein n=1 Tax=Amycolatopsis palatopharyngis TaxID=187982 RepID=UPI000E271BA0|nr:hypothetical protein [Amycolatopsis palatopharyngis]
MSAIPQGVLYLPVMAVWITLLGALLNRDSRIVISILALGAGIGVWMAVGDLPWLLVPVVLLWVAGLVTMIQRQRDSAH